MNQTEGANFLRQLGFHSQIDQDAMHIVLYAYTIISGPEIEMQPDIAALKELVCARIENTALSVRNNAEIEKEKVMRGEKITTDWTLFDDAQ